MVLLNTCSFAPDHFSFTKTSAHIGFEFIGRMRNVLRPVSLALDAPSMFGNLAFGIWQVKTRNKRKNEEEEETFLLLFYYLLLQ